MNSAFDQDDAMIARDEHADLLEQITGHLADIKRAAPPVTEADVGAMRSALDTIAHHAPSIAKDISSIKLAAWIIAAATILHLFR